MGESGKHADGGSRCQRQGEPAAPIHPSRIDMLAHDFRIARQQNDKRDAGRRKQSVEGGGPKEHLDRMHPGVDQCNTEQSRDDNYAIELRGDGDLCFKRRPVLGFFIDRRWGCCGATHNRGTGDAQEQLLRA